MPGNRVCTVSAMPGRPSPQRCTDHACSSRSATPRVRQILVRHHASGSAVSRLQRVTGMAFPSVSWRHSEALGAVVLAPEPGAWGRASFFVLGPCVGFRLACRSGVAAEEPSSRCRKWWDRRAVSRLAISTTSTAFVFRWRNIHDIAGSTKPAPAEQEHRLWYQYYFHTRRGRAGLEANRRDIGRLLWQLWSPNWRFDCGCPA